MRVDSDGYIFPIDRIDNLIISGGENIYPQEVEFFLSKHPAIADVAVSACRTINGARSSRR